MSAKSSPADSELFPTRRIIVRRPASGICQFCLKTISATNWSRHLRSMHMEEIKIMRYGEEALEPKKEPSSAESSPNRELSKEPTVEKEQKQASGKKRHQEPVVKTESIDPTEDMDNTISSVLEQKQSLSDVDEPKQKLRRSARNAKRKSLKKSAIRLPKNNVCPLCNRNCSAGNWSRHLKRHHPEYAPKNDDEEDGEERMDTEDQPDLPVIQLAQFLAQQKEHNEVIFGLSGSTLNSGTQMDGMEQEEDEDDRRGLVEMLIQNQANALERNILENGEHGNLAVLQDELAEPKEFATQSAQRRLQRRSSAIRPDKDGRCPLCAKTISTPNWRRHLMRCHPEEELIAQYKFPDPVCPIPMGVRLFALYAATAPLSPEHLDNEYLKKFLGIVPEFEIPTQRMLEAQMDGEVERLKQCIRNKLSSMKNGISISIHIGPIEKEGANTKDNWMGVCAHFWDQTSQGQTTVGLALANLGCSDDEFVEIMREKLADMELPIGGRINHFVVNKSGSIFAKDMCTKPSFFDPFPFIGGSINSALSELTLPSGFQVLDSSPQALEEFFNGDAGSNPPSPNNNARLETEAPIVFDEDCPTPPSSAFCASRRLSFVLKQVFEHNEFMKELVKRILPTLKQFAFSQQACSALHEQSRGLMILFPADTRWTTLECVYCRLLVIAKHLEIVCNEFNFPCIEPADLESIHKILQIVDTFNKFKAKLEQEDQPSISLLYPGLLHLLDTLQHTIQIPSITDALVEEIKLAFSDVLNSGKDGHNPLFLCASILDPTVAYLVLEKKPEAVRAIREMVKKTAKDSSALQQSNVSVELVEDIVESPFGFGTVRKTRIPLVRGEQSGGDRLDLEIMEYLAVVQLDSTDSPSQFWTKHAQKFPLLAQTAPSILAIPATCSLAKRLLEQVDQQRSDHVAIRKAFLTFNRNSIDLISSSE